MFNQNKVVVVIIAHKDTLSETERMSLKQCFNILYHHPIKIICPIGLNISQYLLIAPKADIVFIDAKWQSSYSMFNRLKISPLLYKKFKKYQYILFYELDAWVFRDDLGYWCDQNYDYIGAPWYEGYEHAKEDSKFIGIGNGGFSLRKISSHLRVLNRLSYITPPHQIIEEFKRAPGLKLRKFVWLLLNLTIRNNTFYNFNDYRTNEDLFWGTVCANKFKWFRVPDENTASHFSMETKAPQLFKKNQNSLPFGCHGWFRYYQDFWKEHITFERTVITKPSNRTIFNQ